MIRWDSALKVRAGEAYTWAGRKGMAHQTKGWGNRFRSSVPRPAVAGEGGFRLCCDIRILSSRLRRTLPRWGRKRHSRIVDDVRLRDPSDREYSRRPSPGRGPPKRMSQGGRRPPRLVNSPRHGSSANPGKTERCAITSTRPSKLGRSDRSNAVTYRPF
jgi:hypothetical protein